MTRRNLGMHPHLKKPEDLTVRPEGGEGGAALAREVSGVCGENVGAGATFLPLPPSQKEYPSSIILFIVEKIRGVYS